MSEYEKARKELIEWFGPTSKYVNNEAWLDGQVKGVVMWRTARKICPVPPAGKDTLIEYWKFLNFMDLAEQYQLLMRRGDV